MLDIITYAAGLWGRDVAESFGFVIWGAFFFFFPPFWKFNFDFDFGFLFWISGLGEGGLLLWGGGGLSDINGDDYYTCTYHIPYHFFPPHQS